MVEISACHSIISDTSRASSAFSATIALMRLQTLPIWLVVLALLVLSPCGSPAAETNQPISVYFSPKGGCTEAIVAALEQAQKSILVQAYSFTSTPIAKALVDAHKRGVTVRVILDKSNLSEKYSSADFLAHNGLETLIDSKHAIAHNKIMIIDGETIITGSFNFTKSAEEHNAENLMIINDGKLAERYTKNWKEHFGHSEKYGGK